MLSFGCNFELVVGDLKGGDGVLPERIPRAGQRDEETDLKLAARISRRLLAPERSDCRKQECKNNKAEKPALHKHEGGTLWNF